MGEIINGEMILSEYGEVVADKWLKTGEIRTNVQLDRFVLMPNHIHGIIFICRGVLQYAPTFKKTIENQ
jgi:REP element-mobilizing transposase RayT